jgi:hypothetical protein
VIKIKSSAQIRCLPAPAGVLEGSRADVSFAAGLLMDKFAWHIPLYRQHQRLEAAGIRVSRPWLTQVAQAVISLLTPIYEAQLASIRASRVKAMDETPIKAGRSGHGKMHTGYFWPIYGQLDEVCFPFHASRSADFVCQALGLKPLANAVLLTDGYAAYAQYAEKTGIHHARCWAHCPESGFIRSNNADTAGILLSRLPLALDNISWRLRGMTGRRADRAWVTRRALAPARAPISARNAPRHCVSSAGSLKRSGSL